MMIRRIVILVACVMGVGVLVPLVLRGRELSKQLVCARNIRTSAKIRGGDHAGGGVRALDQLVASGKIPKEAMVCPSSGLDRCNYVLVPAPAAGQAIDHRAVVMYEPKSNHGDGGNILFADGHASFIRGKRYDLLVREPTRWWEVERNGE